MDRQNLTLLTDLYELTMMQGYFKHKDQNKTVVFDAFFRNNPFGGGYSIMCGVEQLVKYLDELHFSSQDIEYLRSLKIFDEDFLDYLADFKFHGDVYCIPEGSLIFPREPLVKVVAPIMEAQLVETAILCIINHQSLIATKSARIVHAAKGAPIMEFGLRRAQGPDAGTYGARAAVIGGCAGTSNVLCGELFDVPVMGTHAHSWIMSFDDELDAFKTYARLYPTACTLLVDTYDTLKKGVPDAIKTFQWMKEQGLPTDHIGIRLDSGDLAYLTKKARKMLDEAGFPQAKITCSNDLDEHLITSLFEQGACIDSFGVGTHLITAKDTPSFGGVYKLAAVQREDGSFVPKIKLSENTEKITNPGNKKIYRVYEKDSHKIKADLICFVDETFTEDKPLLLFDPLEPWKKTVMEPGTFTLREMLEPVYLGGKSVYTFRKTMDIRSYCLKEQDTLWEESRRLTNPHQVYVDLSQKLYDTKLQLLDQMSAH
ncbi:MAG: nicotinate phosphoribosyltransferase [Lachnospiraceae bacterium]|jgi:nicotinate phosphoribosyltransferase|nr:nicotinate phosphoribosyltransferase [Lachnospiraceae bacterium]MCI1397248.1 nicotinate phosphoribosyltransferase [Lachnospiraceae bacterium]MCI1422694.1 nicotinate phosphoribosyltransferase [Lachnospiraceae bacterium]MCI1451670.1 nicotinate phosphoribosyltransferase [Lachnospiraceae bacterium]